MSSVPPDERTARARILEGAIRCFAEHGPRDTTARKVAKAAGVSPGLVIHHFGSMQGLRTACDEYVAARIRKLKEGAASAGADIDVLDILRENTAEPLLAYLAAVVVEDSPAVAKLVDDMVSDAEEYSKQFVEAGILRPTEYPHARAALLVVWSLGSLVMHKHLERLLGVDLTDPEVTSKPEFAAYALPLYEIYGEGVIAEPFASKARAAFSALAESGIADSDTAASDTAASDIADSDIAASDIADSAFSEGERT